MTIPLTGSIPGLINENTPLWDWMGQLRLGMDPALIRFVEITGTGADYFDATLNRATGMITIAPIAQADYEAFSAGGRSPTLSLGLRFFMTDGTVQTSASNYGVTVLNLDDTAPQSLRFSSGGKVEAKQAGAVIGTLAVTDPDTVSGFTYTVREDDRWLFEIVNGVLKLRSGVSLSVTDGPSRPVVIEVSDGTQSSAFTLDVGVTLPGSGSTGGVDLFEPHERRDGFYWASPTRMVGDHMINEIAAMHRQGDYNTITMRDGESLVFSEPSTLQLLDGTVYFGTTSKAAWVWSAYETILGREPRNYEMWQIHEVVDVATTTSYVIDYLLGTPEYRQKYGTLSNTQFVEQLYLNTSGTISASGVAYHAARLDSGISRGATVASFIDFFRKLDSSEIRGDEGFFVPLTLMPQIDILFRLGGGFLPSSENANWYQPLADGRLTTLDLAQAVASTAGYKAGLGALDTRSFVTQFFTQATGFAPDVATVDAFTAAIDAGSFTRPQYMDLVAWHVSINDSFAYHRPEGAAFANPW